MSDGTIEPKDRPKSSVLKKRVATPEVFSQKEESGEENANFICKECGDAFEHG